MALEILYRDFYIPPANSGFNNFNLLYDKVTGTVQIKESGTKPSPAIIFENGDFREPVSKLSDLTLAGLPNVFAREDLKKRTIPEVIDAAKATKGVIPKYVIDSKLPIPQFPTAPNPLSPPGVEYLNQLFTLGDSVLYELFKNSINELNFNPTNEKEAIGGLFLYPKDILQSQQDTLRIYQYNYKPPAQNSFLNGDINLTAKGGLQRNSALKDYIGTVVLPMPNSIVDSNNVSWGNGDKINDLSAAAASAVMSAPLTTAKDLLNTEVLTQTFNTVVGMVPGLGGIKLPADAMRSIVMLTKIPGMGQSPMLIPALTSFILKQGGFEVSPETILSRGFGVVPNSNLELLFNAPTLRSFKFSYRLSPRDSKEAYNVRKILRFFKQGMSVRKINNGAGVGARSLFLSTPNVFKLEYKSGEKNIKGVNKFKICALTGFSVDYASGTNGWAAYDDPSSPGQPVSLSMTMAFQEIEPVYSDEYDDRGPTGSLTRNDLPAIGLDDVGY